MVIRNKYPEAYQCAERISQFIEKKYQQTISREEEMYLAIHIERVVSRTRR